MGIYARMIASPAENAHDPRIKATDTTYLKGMKPG